MAVDGRSGNAAWVQGRCDRPVRIAALLLACAGLSLIAGCGNEAPPVEDVRPVNVVKVEPTASANEASYTGDVRARYETALGFRVGGKIVAREVEVGSRVKRGQALARLDPSDFRLNIEAQRSQLAATEADFLQARDDLERYRNLYQQKFVSAAEFDRRQNAFNVAKARLEQAQAQLGVTQNQSTYTALRADEDGIITALSAEVGQVVAAGQEVMRLARLDEKEVLISVPESRLDELRRSGEVSVSLWAAPEATFKGRIREVSPAADPVTRTYAVKVTILDPTPQVQLGMTANVMLAQKGASAVVRLPLAALYQQGQTPAVWVVDGKTGTVTLRPVVVVRYTQDAVEIGSGLSAGDMVVRAGVHKLNPGQKVRVLPTGT
ncbi:MAG: efflux RND transporter periplasmic adaptor subunit [Burkholderiales bacterium]|nr:efflux RND transporter periplasmic adaptor subunit [Burkholderiales bacterium]